jgi:hypothetical protein
MTKLLLIITEPTKGLVINKNQIWAIVDLENYFTQCCQLKMRLYCLTII